MLLKVILFAALIALCTAENHAYSSQSIVLHHTEQKGHGPHEQAHYIPVKAVVSVTEKVVSGANYFDESSGQEQEYKYNHQNHKPADLAYSSQNIVLHQTEHKQEQNGLKEPVPVVTKKVIPVAYYAVERAGHEQEEHNYEQQDNKLASHAYSSQNIVLHQTEQEHDAPLKVTVPVTKEVVPVAHYVVKSSGQEQKEHKYENQEPAGHAFSSQSIVLHHTGLKQEHNPSIKKVVPEVHYVEESSVDEHQGHIYEYEDHKPAGQNILHQTEHKQDHIAPFKVEAPVIPKEVFPTTQYVVESSRHEQKDQKYEQHGHKHAISSQHIERHDIPAEAPKGFYDDHGPSKYEFLYKVHDPHTHDVKHQHESRDGHAVHGVYSLHEADGSIRTVHYSADKKTGFQADVQHTTKHNEEEKHHH